MMDSDGAMIEDIKYRCTPSDSGQRTRCAIDENLWPICRRDENTFTYLVQTYSPIYFCRPIVDVLFFTQQIAASALSLALGSRT